MPKPSNTLLEALAPVLVLVVGALTLFPGLGSYGLWEPPDTLPSDDDLQNKFLWLTRPVIGETAAKRLADAIWSAERWSSIDPVIQVRRAGAA